ncbi:MAG: hypothetical protein EXS18_03155 [Verrucomicrobiae bacterium]|nr:hypothetical protein [Verrucomicrobiae bacterium]
MLDIGAKFTNNMVHLIRTETDCGIAALNCQRFATPQYNRLFPHHWYEQDVEELMPARLGNGVG